MKRQLKIAFLQFAKWIGFFALLRMYTNQHLRILCYHGFSETDEHEFRTKYFMQPGTFRARLELIKKMGFSVIPLQDAVNALWEKKLPRNSVVITIDDGLSSVLKYAAPCLKAYEFPSTVYVTTYYVDRQVPICAFAAQYLIWKAWKNLASNQPLQSQASEKPKLIMFRDLKIDLSSIQGRDQSNEKVMQLLDRQPTDQDRQIILQDLETALLPGGGVLTSRQFFLMSQQELREVTQFGIDLQLHTHRHTFPPDLESCKKEILDNIASLNSVNVSSLSQFCYPSGVYHPNQIQWLREMGIRSATTCDNGLVSNSSSPFLMDRILDGENVTAIEIEAELAGFSVLRRHLQKWMGRKSASSIGPMSPPRASNLP
jgi:peptidoglycan/xylan/chitin deacetylase (PgdA/CDA1 family)